MKRLTRYCVLYFKKFKIYHFKEFHTDFFLKIYLKADELATPDAIFVYFWRLLRSLNLLRDVTLSIVCKHFLVLEKRKPKIFK